MFKITARKAKFKRFAFLLAAGLFCFSHAALAEVIYNRGNSAEPQTLDPHKISTVQEANIAQDLFEGLLAYNAKAEPVPAIAESWSISDDGKVYTFKLRNNVRWSNNEPLTAEDFVFAWRRIVTPATGSPYASMLFCVKNGEAIATSKLKPEDLGVRAPDAATFEVTLEKPTPYFLAMLAHPATYPVPKAIVEKFGADWVKPGNMISNGAYTLKDFIPKDKVVLGKNKNYRDAANVQIDIVNYHSIEDRGAAIKRFEAGEIDSYDDVPAEQMDFVRKTFKNEFISGPYLGTYFFWFKDNKPPYNNPKLRRAIALMIDREYLAEKIWAGTMIAGYSLIPPGIADYESQDADFKKMSQFDREDEAKKLMSELGYGPSNLLRIEIRFNTSENHSNTSIALANMMKPFGIEAILLNTDGKTHYGHLRTHGDFDLARAGWVSDYRDPQTFLQIGVTNDGHNYGLYSNPAYDKLVQQAELETDPLKRRSLMQRAEAIIVQDQPFLILLHYRSKNLISKRLKGWETNIMDIHLSRWLTKT
jgi:oligopeptide transport system substrate-binding protein